MKAYLSIPFKEREKYFYSFHKLMSSILPFGTVITFKDPNESKDTFNPKPLQEADYIFIYLPVDYKIGKGVLYNIEHFKEKIVFYSSVTGSFNHLKDVAVVKLHNQPGNWSEVAEIKNLVKVKAFNYDFIGGLSIFEVQTKFVEWLLHTTKFYVGDKVHLKVPTYPTIDRTVVDIPKFRLSSKEFLSEHTPNPLWWLL